MSGKTIRKDQLIPMAQEIDRELAAIRQAVRRPMEAEFARGDLTGPQRAAMQILVGSDAMSLKELSARLGLSHSTVSGIVDRLEKRGLVERRSGEGDGRFTMIVVSPAVREYLRDTLPAIAIHPLVEALQKAKPGERASILEGVRTLRRLLSE